MIYSVVLLFAVQQSQLYVYMCLSDSSPVLCIILKGRVVEILQLSPYRLHVCLITILPNILPLFLHISSVQFSRSVLSDSL